MGAPRVLVVRVLEACNAGCFMCGFAFSRDAYRFTATDAERLSAEIKGGAVRVVRLTGGEPLMLPELYRVVETFASIPVKTSIITNGWFLPERARELSACGLDQIIVSVDGATAGTHDRFRRLPGLFERIAAGIAALRDAPRPVRVRVNSVVGPHNLDELLHLHRVLADWGVDQWSIIPLKRSEGAWRHTSRDRLERAYEEFRRGVATAARPQLLGYSRHWAGRTQAEFEAFWDDLRPVTPEGVCRLVDEVRYYTPKDGLVYPCNCVPHRMGGRSLAAATDGRAFSDEGLKPIRAWLRSNGPAQCTGCEPINAALGEGAIDLEADPLGF